MSPKLAHIFTLNYAFLCFVLGRGVFATKDLEQGEFLVEYRGEHISYGDARKRKKAGEGGCWMFHFKYKGRKHWYDYFVTNNILLLL